MPFVVQMEAKTFGPTAPPIVVMNPGTPDIYVDDPRAYAIGEKLLNLQHAIHFGVGLGWIWKILVFLSGLLPLFLAITGLNVWWRKRRGRNASVPAQASAAAE
jgi:uncharacterized iron-regulated membrane protein